MEPVKTNDDSASEFTDDCTDIEKAQSVLESGKRLLRDLECFPMRISIEGELVECRWPSEVTRYLRELIGQLEEAIAAARGEQNPPVSPFTKGGRISSPLCERGVRGDFLGTMTGTEAGPTHRNPENPDPGSEPEETLSEDMNNSRE